MAALTDDQILDLAVTTQKDLGRLRFQQIAQEIREYEVMDKWLKSDKMVVDNGTGIQRTLMLKLSRSGKHTGLFEVDTVNVTDVLSQISIPWTHYTANYAWERREMLMNGGASKIVDLMKVRRSDMLIGIAEDMEDDAWTAPTSAAELKEIPAGVPYWVVKNATDGFYGQNPGSLSACAGIDSSAAANAKWRNYVAGYTAISQDDLITQMRTAHLKVGFKSPVDISDFSKGNAANQRVYMNDDTYLTTEGLNRDQNENLGSDVGSVAGTLVFKRHPVMPCEKLNADSSNPVYMLNHNMFYPVVLAGDYLRETAPKVASNQHNTYVVHTDLSSNFLCVDRRRQAVIYVR